MTTVAICDPTQTLSISYVLPLRRAQPARDDELASYLAWLSTRLEVVVADGSPPPVFADHARQWGRWVRHVEVTTRCPNGKVAGVLDGLRAARADIVILADDDVRYDADTLSAVVDRLDGADLVRPQNVFSPLPWHARWDTARSLLNRAVGADYPGTLVLRKDALGPEGYCGGVLFENLELIRTVRARGGREVVASDLYIRRVPPGARHFWGQRIRQAYDSWAEPERFAVELALLPALLMAARRRTAVGLSLIPLASVALAEVGRRRHGGRVVFAARAACWAPAWVAERAVCSWLAVGLRMRGGVSYAGHRIRCAAHPLARLKHGCPDPSCGCARMAYEQVNR